MIHNGRGDRSRIRLDPVSYTEAREVIDIEKQVAYWRDGAREDLLVARELVDRGRARHGLFFAHLALEKVLKACVCRRTQDLAPRLHNLVRLGEIAGLVLTESQLDVLAEMNAFSLEGRYPESRILSPEKGEACSYLARAEELFQWLMSQL